MTIPMKELAGKVAFVTGGGSGIGLGIARTLANAQMRVAVTYLTQTELDETTRYFGGPTDRFRAMNVDVTDRCAVEAAAQEALRVFGRVHVVVNNAGVVLPARIAGTSYEDWDRLIAVNVTGVFNGLRAFLPLIQEHGEGGHILATGSIIGLFTATPSHGAYCASKFAVVGLMEALRAELRDTNIGVSVLCPGHVKSNLEPGLKESPIALDPLKVGERVLRGIQNNDLYIFTHPEFGEILELRHEVLMASLPTELEVGGPRSELAHMLARNSIYAAERDRARDAAFPLTVERK